MRDPERIDRIMHKLTKLWHKYPDQRLGQLLANYVYHATAVGMDVFLFFPDMDVFLFFPEDDIAEAHIEMYLEDEE